jgi:hypothetical protein
VDASLQSILPAAARHAQFPRLFIADGSYLFVPDNKNYEGSVRLLFDEHNHPVSKKQQQQMTPAQRDRCRWRRCYKAVFLLHCDATTASRRCP